MSRQAEIQIKISTGKEDTSPPQKTADGWIPGLCRQLSLLWGKGGVNGLVFYLCFVFSIPGHFHLTSPWGGVLGPGIYQ